MPVTKMMGGGIMRVCSGVVGVVGLELKELTVCDVFYSMSLP